jgi:hypothetical protein
VLLSIKILFKIRMDEAFGNSFNTVRFLGQRPCFDLNDYLNPLKIEFFNHSVNFTFPLKFMVVVFAQLYRKIGLNDNDVEYLDFFFHSWLTSVYNSNQLNELIDRATTKIVENLHSFCQRGSDWRLAGTHWCDLKWSRYFPLSGGCRHYKVPDFVRFKHATLNLTPPGQACFLYAVAALLYPNKAKNRNRYHLYHNAVESLKEKSALALPVQLNRDSLRRFGQANNVRFNILAFNEKYQRFYVIFRSKYLKGQTLNLLLLSNERHTHFLPIISLSRLLSTQLKKKTNKVFHCNFCLQPFTTEKRQREHSEICKGLGGQTTIMPIAPDNIFEFTNHKNAEKIVFNIFLDLECSLSPCSEIVTENSSISEEYHVVSFSYLKIRSDGTLFKPVQYAGPNPVEKLFHYLEIEVHEMIDYLNQLQTNNYNTVKSYALKKECNCYICNRVCFPNTNVV